MNKGDELRLSTAQSKAANHINGPALVLAGPGSGKTTVIIERISLLTTKVTEPSRLLSVTFSRAAGREMKERYIQKYPEREVPVFSTVHSLCNTIIKEHEKKSGIVLTRIEGVNNIKGKIINEIWKHVNPNISIPETEEILSLISRKKNTGDLLRYSIQIKNFDKVYKMYEEYKRNNRLIDFDDMIFYARDLLENNKDLRNKWASKYEYIQVDEGQDLSKAQFDVIRYICGNNNVFVVADDDQGIYAFRGADPSCVLDFEKYYPGCKKYYLEENYRSSGRIVELASKVVNTNKNRYEKNLFTINKRGPKIKFRHCKNISEQAKYVCDLIKNCKGTSGVLYRNNLSSILFRLYLSKMDINFKVLGGIVNPPEYMMVKKVLKRIKETEDKAIFLIPKPDKVFAEYVKEGFLDIYRSYYETHGKGRVLVEYLYEFICTLCKLCPTYDKCIELLDKMCKTDDSSETTFTTVHSAKGLEFDDVYIVDLVKYEFPSKDSMKGDLLEEERRLFYVAMTRTRQNLYLVYPETRGFNSEEASIFYEEALLAVTNNQVPT